MYSTLQEIKEQLFDAPVEVKEAFNEVVAYFDTEYFGLKDKLTEMKIKKLEKKIDELDKKRAEANKKKDYKAVDSAISEMHKLNDQIKQLKEKSKKDEKKSA